MVNEADLLFIKRNFKEIYIVLIYVIIKNNEKINITNLSILIKKKKINNTYFIDYNNKKIIKEKIL